MLGRFFGRRSGGNWRPPADELRFAKAAGFDSLQIMNRGEPLAEQLGIEPAELGELFAETGLEPVLELLVFPQEPGALVAALRANLPAVRQIGFTRVHIHPAGAPDWPIDLVSEYAATVPLAQEAGLLFAAEHNAPGHRLLVGIDEVERLVDAVPGLGLVWDINHTRADEVERFLALRERFTLVHVSDTPLPETNHHLPLGRGNVDFSVLRDVDVPLVLEIGGLPHSGGPGLDTDDALLNSLAALRDAAANGGV
ncbi:MAG TPA: TIM barrel protein [Gaiellaceae bacterium]|nr:TIM barrel protein [Gaiellaceae bacterium]